MIELLTRLEWAVLAGAAWAALFVFLARKLGRKKELALYAVALFLTAIAYLWFGLRADAPAGHVGVEVAGAVLFSAAAAGGILRWPMLLAAGWSAHVAWDLFLHHADGPAYAPAWYPLLCVGFDLFLGGYVAGISARPVGGPRRVAAGVGGPRPPLVH